MCCLGAQQGKRFQNVISHYKKKTIKKMETQQETATITKITAMTTIIENLR